MTFDINVIMMRDEYDIKNLNPRPNPYADKLKKQITIRLNASTIEYFKQQAEETGISYAYVRTICDSQIQQGCEKSTITGFC